MRYSDVLLMIAEAATEVAGGPTQEALDALNEVRGRVKASKIDLADLESPDDFLTLIWEERTRELCFEVPRRMELRRHGKLLF